MTESFAAERREVAAIADDLEAIRFRLLGVRSSVRVTEPAPLDDELEMDAATEMRAVIECVIQDCIESAIRDLRDVLRETEKHEEPKEPAEPEEDRS